MSTKNIPILTRIERVCEQVSFKNFIPLHQADFTSFSHCRTDPNVTELTETSTVTIYENVGSHKFYCFTEQCKSDIQTAFSITENYQPEPSRIFSILRKIFEPEFVSAIIDNPQQLIGNIIFLPRIFPSQMEFHADRFVFYENCLSMVLTSNILSFFKTFTTRSKEFNNYFTIEGAKGIGKSFILYFIVCYMISSDGYSVCYLAGPTYNDMDHQYLSIFFNFYYKDIYSELIAKYADFNFENFFHYRQNSLDFKNRKFYFVIDQFNDLYNSFNKGKNQSFFRGIFSSNYNPRLILSGSSNNEYDWDDKLVKAKLKIMYRYYYWPRLEKIEAVQILKACFSQLGISTGLFDKNSFDFLVVRILQTSSSIPNCIFDCVRMIKDYLTELYPEGINFRDGTIYLNQSIVDQKLKFLYASLTRTILSDIGEFFKKHGHNFDSNFVDIASKAIIYGTPIDSEILIYDKKNFYVESLREGQLTENHSVIPAGPVFIKPIHEQALTLFRQTQCQADLDSFLQSVTECISNSYVDFAVMGKLLEVGFGAYINITKEIKFSDNFHFHLDTVCSFDKPKDIFVNKNTLFIPQSSHYPLYDFVLVIGQNNEYEGNPVQVFFVQFTITSNINDKLRDARKKFNNFFLQFSNRQTRSSTTRSKRKFSVLESDPFSTIKSGTLFPVIEWIQACSKSTTNRKFLFREILIHYSREKNLSDADFISVSFVRDQNSERTKKVIVDDFLHFIGIDRNESY